MSRKIKVFLGGYINLLNAQNINCRSLAQFLDKGKFEVFTMTLYSGQLPVSQEDFGHVHIYNCRWPHKVYKYLVYFKGIKNSDVAFLPKREISSWTRSISRLFGTTTFSTVEGILDEELLSQHGSALLKSYKKFDRLYSITSYVRKYNYDNHGLKSEERILYLGIDVSNFVTGYQSVSFKNIVLIGSDLVRKGIADYFDLACFYPKLNFHIVGSGLGRVDVSHEVSKRGLGNVIYHGSLSIKQLKGLLSDMHLHVLPSRSEGFPKVILETAACHIPTITYDDYGANEWLTSGVNGFVVREISEIRDIIDAIIKDKNCLDKISLNANLLAESFSWKHRVHVWQEAIEEMSQGLSN